MLTRIISGAVMVILLVPCIIFSGTIALDIILSALSFMACYEMLGCIKYRRVYAVSVPALVISFFVPLCVRTIDLGIELSQLILIVFVIFMFYLLSFAVFSHGKHTPMNVATVFVMMLYIIFGFSSIIAVRELEGGVYLFLLVFISAWISDTGAYFAGVFFGKHKLIPDVSPKKTVEGAVGGLICCIISFAVFGVVLSAFYNCTPNYLILCLLGLVLFVVSVCGDLIASLVKRNYDLKDYGNLIPGHGGIMDRFDSIIATASVLYVLLNIPFIVNNIL